MHYLNLHRAKGIEHNAGRLKIRLRLRLTSKPGSLNLNLNLSLFGSSGLCPMHFQLFDQREHYPKCGLTFL
jgi:hypothetical protein